MHPKPGHLLAGSLLCLTVLLAAGCGGSSSPSTTSTPATTVATTTTATTSTAAATTSTTMTTGTTSTSASGTTTTSTTAASSGSLTSASNCADLTNLSSAFSEAFSGTGGSSLSQRLALFQKFAAQTPSAIRPDFEIISTDYAKIVAALGGVTASNGTPNPAEVAKLASLEGSINEQQLGQAEAAIGQWAATNCTGG